MCKVESKFMEVGKHEPQSKAYMVKESVPNKPKALVSHERISNYYTAGNWGRNILMILMY